MKKLMPYVKRALPLIGILLALVIYSKIDFAAIRVHLASIRPDVVALTFAVTVLSATVRATRWHLIMSQFGALVRFPQTLKYHFIGIFLGIATPGRLGEFAKFAYIKKEDGSVSARYLLTVLIDRGFDAAGLVVCALAVFGGYRLMHGGMDVTFNIVLILAIALAAGLIGWSLRNVIFGVAENLLVRVKAPSLAAKIQGVRGFLDTFSVLDLTKYGSISIVSWGLYVLIFILAARSLGIGLAPLEIALSAFVAAVAVIIPVSFAGIGTREAALIYTFGLFGGDQGAAVSLALLIFIYNICLGLFGAGLYFHHHRLSGNQSHQPTT